MRTHKTQKGYEYSELYYGYGKVYTLSDKSGNVFYVGCTTGAMNARLSGHISEARANYTNSNKTKNKIIADSNFDIVATIVEIKWLTWMFRDIYRCQTLKKLERQYIKKYLDLGYDLCNREAKRKEKLLDTPEFIGQTFTTKQVA